MPSPLTPTSSDAGFQLTRTFRPWMSGALVAETPVTSDGGVVSTTVFVRTGGSTIAERLPAASAASTVYSYDPPGTPVWVNIGPATSEPCLTHAVAPTRRR